MRADRLKIAGFLRALGVHKPFGFEPELSEDVQLVLPVSQGDLAPPEFARGCTFVNHAAPGAGSFAYTGVYSLSKRLRIDWFCLWAVGAAGIPAGFNNTLDWGVCAPPVSGLTFFVDLQRQLTQQPITAVGWRGTDVVLSNNQFGVLATTHQDHTGGNPPPIYYPDLVLEPGQCFVVFQSTSQVGIKGSIYFSELER